MDAWREFQRGGARCTMGNADFLGVCGVAGVGEGVGDLGGGGGVWVSVAACRYVIVRMMEYGRSPLGPRVESSSSLREKLMP